MVSVLSLETTGLGASKRSRVLPLNPPKMVALEISRYNPLRRVAKYRRKHGLIGGSAESGDAAFEPGNDIRDLRYTDSEAIIQSYDPDTAVKTYKQKQKRLSDEEVRQVVERYNAGASTYELADEFGVHRSTISRALKKCGIKVTHKFADRDALAEKILELYADFMNPEDIGKVVDLHKSTVLKILHENGVRIRSSGEYKGRR